MTGNPRISEKEAAKLIALRIESTRTRNYGYYRVGALRSFGGGRKVVPRVEPKLQSVSHHQSCIYQTRSDSTAATGRVKKRQAFEELLLSEY